MRAEPLVTISVLASRNSAAVGQFSFLAVGLVEAPAVVRAAADHDAAVIAADRHRAAASTARQVMTDGKARNLVAGNAYQRVAAGVQHAVRGRREIVDFGASSTRPAASRS